MEKLSEENQLKWIEALESGKYPKTVGQLKKDNGYCCLGVLACVLGKELDDDGKNIKSGDAYGGGLGLEYRLVKKLVVLNDEIFTNDTTFEELIPELKKVLKND